MAKTSYRLPDETLVALAELADKSHNGNRTAALLEAITRYYESAFGETLGWVSVRIVGKVRCTKCNNPIDGQGFARLAGSGRLEGRLVCGKCAK